MKKILFAVLIFIFICGCSTVQQMNPEVFKSLLISAAEGNKSANDSLSGIFNLDINTGAVINVSVDTISLKGTKFFAASIEFENTTCNRFGIYDENLNCYIIDRSLNGKLVLSAEQQRGFSYFTLEENYYSNDLIELKRFSLFRGDTSGFDLAFRTFTLMKTPDTVFLHNLYEITPDNIKTNITAPVFSGLNNFNDDYPYDITKNVYDIRKEIYFDEFVIDFISSINDTLHKFIKPVSSKENKEITAVFNSTSITPPDYYLNLNENWRELKNLNGGGLLLNNLSGSKFINDIQNSNIHVFRIPFTENAEKYIDAKLTHEVKGNYFVRYSDDYINGKNLKKYFEYSCSTKKFLLILTALKNTFPVYEQEYLEIINTFYINC